MPYSREQRTPTFFPSPWISAAGLWILAVVFGVTPGHAQDKSGIVGAGGTFYTDSDGVRGHGFVTEIGSHLHRTSSPYQFRLALTYAHFRDDEQIGGCDVRTESSCLVDRPTVNVFSASWFPAVELGRGRAVRIRVAPLGVGALLRRVDTRLELGPQPCLYSTPEACEAYRDRQPDKRDVRQMTTSEVTVSYGLAVLLEGQVVLEPFTLQVGFKVQQDLSRGGGSLLAPIVIGYSF